VWRSFGQYWRFNSAAMNKKRRIGVCADDITGSNDIGVMFAKNGYSVKVISLCDSPEPSDFGQTDVLVINTASRLDDAVTAARKTRAAAAFFKSMDCDMVYTKTCSVFRGNIGACFDAVQDVMGIGTSPVIAAFPRNGRTTADGVHMLNGVPVAETHFAHDPVTPLRFSRLDELIGIQSQRPCSVYSYRNYRNADEVQKAEYERLKSCAAYVIMDARSQEELRSAAKLIAEERNICGSSAVCEVLPEVWDEKTEQMKLEVIKDDRGGAAVFAGSLTPQTAAQVKVLEDAGISVVIMDSSRLITEKTRNTEAAAAVDKASEILKKGANVLIYASRDTGEVRRKASVLGLSDIAVGRSISLAFEAVARGIREACGCSRYIVAGGETSDAVSRGLNVRTMRIWQEIEAGVPLMTAETAGGKAYTLVFKSGSFGGDHFLKKALDLLNCDDRN